MHRADRRVDAGSGAFRSGLPTGIETGSLGMNDVRHEIVLSRSPDDQAFVAEVPELPGCAADGATYQEAVASVQVVIAEWIDTARELGRPVPAPRRRLSSA